MNGNAFGAKRQHAGKRVFKACGRIARQSRYKVGIYVFKAASLHKMVSLPTGVLEKREALEQLRALENGMEVRAMLVDNIKLVPEAPADINTEEDLVNALPYIK